MESVKIREMMGSMMGRYDLSDLELIIMNALGIELAEPRWMFT